MTTLQLDQPRSDCLPDLTGYWLRHCQGFQVFGPDGRVGFVEAVHKVGDHVDIVIAAGLFRHRTLVAHDRDVDELDVARRRVNVHRIGTLGRASAAPQFDDQPAFGDWRARR